jgi:adenylate cyclase
LEIQIQRFPDKPSIAVVPFQNMSGDPEQEYFTDGVTEDIVTSYTSSRREDRPTAALAGSSLDSMQVGEHIIVLGTSGMRIISKRVGMATDCR